VLFLDQPIGTGYSTSGSDSSYATSEEDVADDLYFFLMKWFDQYKQYSNVPLFLTGESYAGHYIPAFGFKILTENDNIAHTGNPFVNLQGVAIGDGLTDPCSQVEAGPRAAYDFGLVDLKTYASAKEVAVRTSLACAKQDWAAAHDLREEMESTVLDACGINKYDVRTFDSYDPIFDRMDVYLNQPEAKKMLHVPQDVPFMTDAQVPTKLYDDVMQSQKDKFPLMLERIRVLLYQGQFDWKDGPFSNEKWLERISWSGKEGYMAARRQRWRIKDDVEGSSTSLAGWVQTYGSLTEVVVNGAGHLAPMDQPQRLYQMITTFVQNEQFLTDDGGALVDRKKTGKR
jgi:vitellogenic carboxypeptidase-like protein